LIKKIGAFYYYGALCFLSGVGHSTAKQDWSKPQLILNDLNFNTIPAMTNSNQRRK